MATVFHSFVGIPASYLEDYPRTCKCLGSPPFINHKWPFGRGPTTRSLRDLLTLWLLSTYPSHGTIPAPCKLDHDFYHRDWLKGMLVTIWETMVDSVPERQQLCWSKTHRENGRMLVRCWWGLDGGNQWSEIQRLYFRRKIHDMEIITPPTTR